MKLVLVAVILLTGVQIFARDVFVHGYVRPDNEFVQSYHRSSPDNTPDNNYEPPKATFDYGNENINKAMNTPIKFDKTDFSD